MEEEKIAITGMMVVMMAAVVSSCFRPPEEEPTPPPEPGSPAELELSSLRFTWTGLYTDRIMAGDTVHIRATARNKGALSGSFEITWTVNGTTYTETLDLLGGQIKVIEYTYVPQSAGTFNVEVDGLKGSFKVQEEVAEPSISITKMSYTGGNDKHQGDSFTVDIDCESNFTGRAWLIVAYGQGKPSAGASFSPIYNVYGDYLGWFPSPFKIITKDYVTIGPYVASREIKKGLNRFSIAMGIPRVYPVGQGFYAYAALMPPADNWYQWPDPYDWEIKGPFQILEEGPQITVTEPMVSERVSCGGGWLHRDGFAHDSGVDIGLFSASRNRLCFNELSWEGGCVERDYYMEFINHTAGESITHPHYPDCRLLKVSNLRMGIMVRSVPPETPYGYPAKYYDVEITGWLTYPDGHTEQKSTIDKTPVAQRDYRKENFHIVPLGPGTYRRFEGLYDGGIDQPIPKGKYTVRLKLVCEGIVFCDKTKSFTII